MELRSRSLLPQSERGRPQSVDSTPVDWEKERLRLDETAPNDSQEQFRSDTHRGTSPQRPMSPRRLDNPDPYQDNDLPLWRSSFQSPGRKPQVDFEDTFQGFSTHSPMREQERQPYQAVRENSAFRPVMTGQDYTRNSLNSNCVNYPTLRAPEPLHVHVPHEHDRHLIRPQFQQYGPYRAPDEVAVRPFDYTRLLPRNYDNRYQFNDIKPRPPSFDGKPDAWEPFLMQIQMMSRSYGWPDYKFRDQLMFALGGEALLYASNLPIHVREDTELLISAMEQRFGQCLLAETHRVNLNNIKKQPRETIQQYSARVSQLMTRAYPGIQGTGIFDNLAIEHLLRGLPDQKMAYEIMTKKPRTLSETVDMITWHEACRQQTVKSSGICRIEDHEYYSEYDSDDSDVSMNLRRVSGRKTVTDERINQLWRDMKMYLSQQIEKIVNPSSEDTQCAEISENERKKNPYKDLTCYKCDEKGHISPDCPKKQTVQKLKLQENEKGLPEMA